MCVCRSAARPPCWISTVTLAREDALPIHHSCRPKLKKTAGQIIHSTNAAAYTRKNDVCHTAWIISACLGILKKDDAHAKRNIFKKG